MKYMKLYEDISTIYQIDKAIKICEKLDNEIDTLLDSQTINELKLILDQIASGGAVNPNLKYLSENVNSAVLYEIRRSKNHLKNLVQTLTDSKKHN